MRLELEEREPKLLDFREEPKLLELLLDRLVEDLLVDRLVELLLLPKPLVEPLALPAGRFLVVVPKDLPWTFFRPDWLVLLLLAPAAEVVLDL